MCVTEEKEEKEKEEGKSSRNKWRGEERRRALIIIIKKKERNKMTNEQYPISVHILVYSSRCRRRRIANVILYSEHGESRTLSSNSVTEKPIRPANVPLEFRI